jgi:hypothetical protein
MSLTCDKGEGKEKKEFQLMVVVEKAYHEIASRRY